jgi:hypothetical protein
MAFLPGKLEDGSLSKKAPPIWEKLFPKTVAPLMDGSKFAIEGAAGQGDAARRCRRTRKIVSANQWSNEQSPPYAAGDAVIEPGIDSPGALRLIAPRRPFEAAWLKPRSDARPACAYRDLGKVVGRASSGEPPPYSARRKAFRC